MKPSKQPAGIARPNARETRQDPEIRATVFSNYVFVTPRRHPGETAVKTRVHGAALLVFSDQPRKQIPLAAREKPLIGGDAPAGPREKLVDEAMSRHKKPKKEITMNSRTPEIRCGACDAVVAPGEQNCPGCGLALVAQAQQAVYVEGPRFSFWAVLGVAALVLFLALEIFGRK